MRALRLRLVPSLGVTLLAAVAIGNVALWLVARPPNQPTGRYVGELCGAEAVLLLSCAPRARDDTAADRARIRRA